MDIKKIIETLSSHVEVKDVPEGTGSLVAGNESANTEVVVDGLKTLASSIEAGFSAAAVEGGLNLEPYQVTLAVEAAALAVAPLTSLKDIIAHSKDPKVTMGYEKIAMTTPEYSDMSEVTSGFESFDGQTVKPNVTFALIYTAMASKQDAGAELLFPVIPIPANSSGAIVDASITSVINEFVRPISGVSNKDMYQREALVKIANDPAKMDIDKNRLVPVLRDDSADLMLEDLKDVVTYNGEKVTTAPLKVGEKINILGISQTDSMLAKGSMDITDALDAAVTVKKVYYTIGEDVMVFDISSLGASFTYSVSDHHKDILINLNTNGVGLNTTTTKKADGSVSAALEELPAGYNVSFEMLLNGSGNTRDGDIELFVNRLTVSSVTDGAGREVPEDDDDYIAIVEGLKDVAGIGYEVEAYLTNTNARIRGLLISGDKYSEVYNVPFRVGYTTLMPIVNNGTDGDADNLNTAIGYAQWKINASAYTTLNNFIAFMRNSGPDAELKGVASKMITKWFSEESTALNTIVDGTRSEDRLADIKAALALRIKTGAIDAYVSSNYGVALNTTSAGTKATVVIVTDPQIAMFLGNSLESDTNFNYKIASTVNPLMKGKIVYTFGLFDGSRNTKANVLNFGQCFHAPDIIIPIVKTINNGTAIESTTMNRYLHCINLPILGVLNVSGVQDVISKLTVNVSK